MKYLLVLSMFMMGVLDCAGSYRVFTDQTGRTVDAAILKYDSVSGKVQLATKSGRKVWVDPVTFASADQEFIKQWLRLEPFLNEEVLKISIKKKEGDWRVTGKIGFSTKTRKEKITRYLIHLDNTSDSKLSRLRMDYCVYTLKTTGSKSYIGTKFHSKTIGIIKPKEQKDLSSVSCPNIKGTSTGGTDEIIGACFRFYTSIPGGEEVMREIRFPSLLSEKKYPWKAPEAKKKFKL
jgi:hypothetical protein